MLKSIQYKALTGIFFLLFLLGFCWPEAMWGVHVYAFFPPLATLLFCSIGAGLVLVGWKRDEIDWTKELHLPVSWSLIYWGLAVVFAVACYQLPIADDYYGNARSFIPDLDKTAKVLPEDFWSTVFSIEVKPGNGRWGVYQMIILFSHLFDTTILQSFRWTGALFGGAYLLVWGWAIGTTIQSNRWRFLLLLLGCSAPYLLVYFGHIEAYAPVYFLLMCWSVALLKYQQTKKTKFIWVLAVVSLLSIRLHTLSVLCMPGLLLVLGSHFSNQNSWFSKLNSLKGMFLWVLGPISIVGLGAYFFVFKDFNDPRFLTAEVKDIERLFLPILSPQAPLDRYNLLSWNHFLDYFNVVLFWSPAMLFVFFWILTRFRKQVNWDRIALRLQLLTLLLFLALFFMINPLLSMPMDWDLFCYPATLLLGICLVLIHELENKQVLKVPLFSVLGLTVLALPVFAVFSNKTMQHERVEAVGRHVFKTYYEHSGTYLLYALQGLEPDTYAMRKQQMLNDLAPFAMPGNDKKYADLLVDDAMLYLNQLDDPKIARERALEAMIYFPEHQLLPQLLDKIFSKIDPRQISYSAADSLHANQWMKQGKIKLREQKDYLGALTDFGHSYYFMPIYHSRAILEIEALYLLGKYEDAYTNSVYLMQAEYPSEYRALRMGLQLALEAQKYPEASRIAIQLNHLKPDDALVIEVKRRLEQNQAIDELKLLFRRSRN